jgi:hypothetical protein
MLLGKKKKKKTMQEEKSSKCPVGCSLCGGGEGERGSRRERIVCLIE